MDKPVYLGTGAMIGNGAFGSLTTGRNEATSFAPAGEMVCIGVACKPLEL